MLWLSIFRSSVFLQPPDSKENKKNLQKICPSPL